MPARTASASSGEPGAVSGSGSRTERVPVKAARVALRTCARTTRAAELASIWVRADATEVRTSAGDEASPGWRDSSPGRRSEEHTSELQSRFDLVCRLLLDKKNTE